MRMALAESPRKHHQKHLEIGLSDFLIRTKLKNQGKRSKTVDAATNSRSSTGFAFCILVSKIARSPLKTHRDEGSLNLPIHYKAQMPLQPKSTICTLKSAGCPINLHAPE